ncbi:hypothetical protein, partial [Bradyrhizobium sp.]|uniref:hypothetical protein n=1 Tax=Bradyrhizobium sp. TaxID=376 RepID=UPI00239F52B8
ATVITLNMAIKANSSSLVMVPNRTTVAWFYCFDLRKSIRRGRPWIKGRNPHQDNKASASAPKAAIALSEYEF